MSAMSLGLRVLTVATIIFQNNTNHRLNSSRNQINRVYDFIVIGSGSAGAIVAARLAENPRIQVLLLEAGLPPSVLTDIPAQYSALLGSRYDWNYTNIQHSVGLAFEGQRIRENRGFVLGGSSSTNSMIFNRGNKKTFDEWALRYGAQGWSYREVLPFFMKYENNTDPRIVANGLHGTRGPIQVSTCPDPINPMVVVHQRALTELGFPTIDINGPTQLGTTLGQGTIDARGVRASTANAYLDPNPFPNNLHIITGALVTKVLFTGRTAIGVEFVRRGRQLSVRANREVIVSAGTINSPQLLMLSGIGPSRQLAQFGIPLVANLPVGEHMQNHAALAIYALIRQRYQSLLNTGDSSLTVDRLYEYYVNNSGFLRKNFVSVTYLNTDSNREKDWPNVAFEASPVRFPNSTDQLTTFRFGARRREWNEYFRGFYGNFYYFIQPLLQRIFSFGFVRLQSNNPFVYPIINSGFLSDSRDFENFVYITRFVFRFFERSSIAQYVERIRPIPGCQPCPNTRFLYECDSYIRCHIRQLTFTGYHPVGTCRMGDVRRNDVVVDPRLRVKGMNRLRVCDASVMPKIPNGNTNAASLMIGEKCAQLVKEDNRLLS